jgi:hypothetical protein
MPEIWRSLTNSLAIHEDRQQVLQTPGAPILSGVVERRADDPHPELLLRLDKPAPGIAHLFAMPMGAQVMVSIRFYLYGDQGAASVARAEGEWTDWLAVAFPQATGS